MGFGRPSSRATSSTIAPASPRRRDPKLPSSRCPWRDGRFNSDHSASPCPRCPFVARRRRPSGRGCACSRRSPPWRFSAASDLVLAPQVTLGLHIAPKRKRQDPRKQSRRRWARGALARARHEWPHPVQSAFWPNVRSAPDPGADRPQSFAMCGTWDPHLDREPIRTNQPSLMTIETSYGRPVARAGSAT